MDTAPFYLSELGLQHWQAQNGTIALGPITMLVGPHGSGKTAMQRAIAAVQAIDVPGFGGATRPGELADLLEGDKATLHATFSDGLQITTELSRTATGASRTVSCNAATGRQDQHLAAIRARLGYHPIASNPARLHTMTQEELAAEFARLCHVQTTGTAQATIARLRREFPAMSTLGLVLPAEAAALAPDKVLGMVADIAEAEQKAAEKERKAQAALVRADLPALPDEAERESLVAALEAAHAATEQAKAEEVRRQAEEEQRRALAVDRVALEVKIVKAEAILAELRLALAILAEPPALLPVPDPAEQDTVAARLTEAERELDELRRRQETIAWQQREHDEREQQRQRLLQDLAKAKDALALPEQEIDREPERQAEARLQQLQDGRKGLRVEALRNRYADLSRGIEELLVAGGEAMAKIGMLKSQLAALEQQRAQLASGVCPLCGSTEQAANKTAELAVASEAAHGELKGAEDALALLRDDQRQAERDRAELLRQGQEEKAKSERLEVQIRKAQQELQTIQRSSEQARQSASEHRIHAEATLQQAQVSLAAMPPLPAPEQGVAERLAREIFEYDADRSVVAEVCKRMATEAERIRRHNEQAAPQRAVWQERKSQAEQALAVAEQEQAQRRARLAEINAMPQPEPMTPVEHHEVEQEQAARDALAAWDAAYAAAEAQHKASAEAEEKALRAKLRRDICGRLVTIAYRVQAEILAETMAPLVDLIRPNLLGDQLLDVSIDLSGGGWRPLAKVRIGEEVRLVPFQALSEGQWAELAIPLSAAVGRLHGARYVCGMVDLSRTDAAHRLKLVELGRRMVAAGELSQVLIACHEVPPGLDLAGITVVEAGKE